ncbi:hypothetical protein LPJ78_005743 [Coemansia sp. RSA 989]|nr:hypothetical protein LPJ79_005771 [Coemansia sp. RSA 1821]KAJ1860649.1 hypothetical protein LPJ78_005743 [Coemansia sp. RSA 989]KAJ1868804.1 hypothetical protein LPJ55_005757 [Coemansia sp. RSA 990]KAJ2675196.1 hypothetical protein IWW42_001342 [Coemansia sp. RSA 1085]
MSSSNPNRDAAEPQPIPPASSTRRNSFAGWSQSLFGLPARPAGATSPPPARTFSSAASLPDASPSSAVSSMGLFRRFSASQVPSAAGLSGAPAPRMQSSGTASDTASAAAAVQGLAAAVGPPAGPKAASPHRLPRALEEVREAEDPPSRPDSRMRNLMLSGQFLI